MLAQLTVRVRLLILALLPLVMLLLVIVLALTNAAQLNQRFQELFTDRMQPISQIKTIADAYAVSIVDASHKYRAEVFDAATLRQNFKEARQRTEQAWAAYTATHLTAEESTRVRRIEAMFSQADRLTDELLGEVDNGRLRAQEPKAFNERLYGVIDPLSGELEALIKLQLDEGVKLNGQVTEQYASMRGSFLVLGGLALFLVLGAALLIGRSITRPLNGLGALIGEVQRTSDLTLRAQVAGRDELSVTARAFNTMLEHLQGLIRHLDDAAALESVELDRPRAVGRGGGRGGLAAAGHGDLLARVGPAPHRHGLAGLDDHVVADDRGQLQFRRRRRRQYRQHAQHRQYACYGSSHESLLVFVS